MNHLRVVFVAAKIYTGIGSRDCPEYLGSLMTKTAQFLYNRGYILRSGGAAGADTFHELGFPNNKETYVPRIGFRGCTHGIVPNLPDFIPLAKIGCKHFNKIKDKMARDLHTRNVCQLIGNDIKNPILSDFVLCYTHNGEYVGGTATAMNLADHFQIPMFNYGAYSSYTECKEKLRDFLKEQVSLG